MATDPKADKPARKVPANRKYVFAKNCWNDHGRFAIGDKARGAFSDELVKSYVEAGILVEAPAARLGDLVSQQP